MAPTLWVTMSGSKVKPTQKSTKLKRGVWQTVSVEARISARRLQRVRAELYFEPAGSELILDQVALHRI